MMFGINYIAQSRETFAQHSIKKEVFAELGLFYTIIPATGAIQPGTGITSGTHLLSYTICDNVYGSICQTANVIITVPNSARMSNAHLNLLDIEKTTISPNPNDGTFTIYFNTAVENATIEVYTIVGQKVYSENVTNSTQQEVTINELASGTYIVKISSNDQVVCKRIVIK